MDFDWSAVSAITSAIGLMFLAAALVYSALQIRTTRHIAQAQYVMDYFRLLQEYNDIQFKLAKGEWSSPETGPQTPEQWFRLERYMGLLEQLEVFVRSDVMSIEVTDRNYSHRIHAIFRNDVIRSEEFERQAFRWSLFLKLIKRLEFMPVYQGLSKKAEGGRARG